MPIEEDILDSWAINARLNLFLLQAVAPEAWRQKAPKSKSPAGHFSHIHNVRLLWLRSAAPELIADLTKLEEGASPEEVGAALQASDQAMRAMIEQGLTAGRIKGFKPHPAAFVAYFVAHEAFHRAQIELVLRQRGHPISDKVAFGLWEWGVR